MLKKIMKFIYHKYDDGLYCIYKIFGIKIITKPLRLQINNLVQKIDNLEKSMRDELWNVGANIKSEMWSVAANVNENSWNVGGNVKNELWATTKNIKDNTQNGFNTFALYLPQIMKSVDYSAIIGSIPCVSVIVIVYNLGEKYIRPCLESVVNQTLKNIEIIIVNDASPHIEDDLICREYASKDKRIKYIVHKENTGAGGARMTGIKQATGHSIAFVDGDDYLSLNCYEIVFSQLISSNVDIVSFGYYFITENIDTCIKNIDYISYQIPSLIYGNEIIKNFCNGSIYPSVWNKLYRRELLLKFDSSLMPKLYRAQDLAANFKIFSKANSLLNLPINLYYYNFRKNSKDNTIDDKYIYDIDGIFRDIIKYINNNNLDGEYKEYINKSFASNFILYTYKKLKNAFGSDDKILNEKLEILSKLALNMPNIIDLNSVLKYLNIMYSYDKDMLSWFEKSIENHENNLR